MLIHHQPESKCTPFLIPVAGSLPIPLQSIQSSILGGQPHLFFLCPELIILARLSRKVIDCFISPVPLCDQLRAVTVVPCLSEVPEASYLSETWHPGPSVIKLDASNPSVVFLAPVIQSSAPGSQAWHFSVPVKALVPQLVRAGALFSRNLLQFPDPWFLHVFSAHGGNPVHGNLPTIAISGSFSGICGILAFCSYPCREKISIQILLWV